MNTLITSAVLAIMSVVTSAAPGGLHGAVLTGPAGVVTSHGAFGPAGHGINLGYGGAVSYASVVAPALGATPYFAGPAAPAVLAGPALGGHGLGLAHGGVEIRGPITVPAVISGPAGKIVADGLYGVPAAHHGWGGW